MTQSEIHNLILRRILSLFSIGSTHLFPAMFLLEPVSLPVLVTQTTVLEEFQQFQ